jgi:hypothetical protein
VTYPLHGCRLRAYAVRHVDGVPHLKVELPDGMPGLVAAEATAYAGQQNTNLVGWRAHDPRFLNSNQEPRCQENFARQSPRCREYPLT